MGGASHYDTLGLTAAATHDEVRQAYIERALRHHPDRQDGRDLAGRAEAERRMQEVNAAWSVLGNREARAAYDADLGIPRREGDLDDVPPADLAETPADLLAPHGVRSVLRRLLPLLLVLAGLLAFLVFTAYAGAGRS